ncbi:hypothetical protein LMG23994_04570 [Cupriavidus pinatubonensis]|uniref:Uncharacterized protein n=1 Tax=Cupriavidus pinatubonensis TaxID=248026 RepID=A0ABN7Z8Q3_9BURK|nr:hypothetical protein LMG23994_04570 [Cupriavidus pinatubonensis]
MSRSKSTPAPTAIPSRLITRRNIFTLRHSDPQGAGSSSGVSNLSLAGPINQGNSYITLIRATYFGTTLSTRQPM